MKRWCWLVAILCSVAVTQTNLVPNGDFEQDNDHDGVPDFWAVAGAPHVKQHLTRDVGRNGKGFSGKLVCTEFGNGTPASHAMICQVGTVSVQRGRFYRLSFWAKAEGIRSRSVGIALVNTRRWSDVGLQDSFSPTTRWQRFEFFFQATDDLAAKESRLQFWFTSTGTLWLDDVELVEIPELRPQRFPQLPTDGVVNFLPNSSFECGTSGWGSYAPDLRWWMGNVFQLVGELDERTAAHGQRSLRLMLNESNLPTFFFDWFDPVCQPVRSLVTAHHGWVPVQRGQPYTFSAFLKADRPNIVGILLVRQSDGRTLRRNVSLTTEWQRYAYTFTPQADFVWVGAGLDLAASKVNSATVWLDALQLERGEQPTPYQPRRPVEVVAATPALGNIFVTDRNPALLLQLSAYAEPVKEEPKQKGAPQQRTHKLTVTVSVQDFFDAEVLRQRVSLDIPFGRSVTKTVTLPVGKFGFYRVRVEAPDGAFVGTPLRCAVIKPYRSADSRWGMNHAYPWAFLLRLAHQAGILWWRDWSVQWRTVQPRPDAPFDFREPDIQIDRVIKEGGQVLVLFPFPSAEWSSSGDPDTIEKVQPLAYRRAVMLVACKPKDEQAFTNYIAESVRHYRNRVRAYHIFNEPLYTFYSLPASLGHTLDDYLRLLRLAFEAIKREQPDALVVGGIGIWADNQWTRKFVEAGGLSSVDVLDLHLYGGGAPEGLCEPLKELWQRMQQRSETKPIWLTEIGCYADDDPPIEPLRSFFGDAAMRRSLHPSERSAAEWMVKFATLFFAYGGEKIFLHAGTCGEINGVDTGSVFFEYGGAPRKIYAAVAAMAHLLPPQAKFERISNPTPSTVAYWFRIGQRRIGIAWSTDERAHTFRLPQGMQALDIMGNPLPDKVVFIGATPIYLTQ